MQIPRDARVARICGRPGPNPGWPMPESGQAPTTTVMTTIASEANARTKRSTADEVLRMADLGMLDEGEPVELLEGDLVVVAPQGPARGIPELGTQWRAAELLP